MTRLSARPVRWSAILAALVAVVCLCAAQPASAQGSGAKLMGDGEKALASGDHDGAIDALSKAIKSGSLAKPDMAKAFVARGQALQGKGSHARAVADFTNALWLESLSSSDTARALALRGTSRQVLGQAKAAADDFKKAEAADPGVAQRLGGAASAAPASRTAARGSDDGGFLGNLFGGSDDTAAREAPASRPAAGTRSPAVASRRAPASETPSDSGRGSVGDFFSSIFGADDKEDGPATQPAPSEPVTRQRLAASPPPASPTPAPPMPAPATGPRRLLPTTDGAAASTAPAPRPVEDRRELLGNILAEGDAPPPAPAEPLRQARIIEPEEEPGFFERLFDGSVLDREPDPEPAPTRIARADGPAAAGRLRPASESPDAWRTVATPSGRPTASPARPTAAVAAPRPAAAAPAGPATQRDTRLPTFVNQPRLTDRILGNDAVEPTAGGSTRLAALDTRPARPLPRGAAATAPSVSTVPAEYDWTETTRVERGPQPGPIVRQTVASAPRPVPPAAAPQVIRRPAPAPAPRAAAPRPAPAPASGAGSTLGSSVRSAVDWIGEQLTVEPAAEPRRVASAPKPAPARQTARTSYRPPAAPARQATTETGGYVVQLAARQQRADAEAAARSAASRHGALFGGARPYIARADIPGKGTYYRVRVGPYRTQAQVASLCGQLKSRGQDCFVTRN